MTHADELEAVSVDEALLDVTSSTAQFAAVHPDATDPAKEFADAIRTEVKEATGCECKLYLQYVKRSLLKMVVQ